jgi:hypothetical protein
MAEDFPFTVSLFDGTTLNGWKALREHNSKFRKVSGNTLVAVDGVTIPQNAYLPHPNHKDVKDLMVPRLERVVVFNFNL